MKTEEVGWDPEWHMAFAENIQQGSSFPLHTTQARLPEALGPTTMLRQEVEYHSQHSSLHYTEDTVRA
jgi:hypothetical protein